MTKSMLNTRSIRAHRKLWLVASLVICGSAAPSFAQYTFTSLGSATGPTGTSTASGISQNGTYITGGSTLSAGNEQAYLYNTTMANSGTLTTLGTLNGNAANSNGLGVNNSGHVVGTSDSFNGVTHGFFYNGTALLDTTGGHGFGNGNASEAYAVNNADVLVGGVYHSGATGPQYAYYSVAATSTDTTVGSSANGNGGTAIAFGISNTVGTNTQSATSPAGYDFVGETQTAAGPIVQAFENATNGNAQVMRLGSFYGSNSVALAINDSGGVVGQSEIANGSPYSHATYNPTPSSGPSTTIDLGTLATSMNLTNSIANAINDSGIIVGQSDTDTAGVEHAFIYENGVMSDLNNLVTTNGFTLTDATGIDSAGDIVGDATNNSTGVEQGFEITFVPEPASISLLGLSLVGLAGRRRRRMAATV